MTLKTIYECDACKEQCERLVFRVLVHANVVAVEYHACDLECYVQLLDKAKTRLPELMQDFKDQVEATTN